MAAHDLKITLKTAEEIEEIKPLDIEFELDFNFDGLPEQPKKLLNFE